MVGLFWAVCRLFMTFQVVLGCLGCFGMITFGSVALFRFVMLFFGCFMLFGLLWVVVKVSNLSCFW